MLCSKMLKKEERTGISAWLQTRFERLERRYEKLIGKALVRPRPAIAAVGVFLVIAAGLFLTLKSELAPTEDVGLFQVNLSAPDGTAFDPVRQRTLLHSNNSTSFSIRLFACKHK